MAPQQTYYWRVSKDLTNNKKMTYRTVASSIRYLEHVRNHWLNKIASNAYWKD